MQPRELCLALEDGLFTQYAPRQAPHALGSATVERGGVWEEGKADGKERVCEGMERGEWGGYARFVKSTIQALIDGRSPNPAVTACELRDRNDITKNPRPTCSVQHKSFRTTPKAAEVASTCSHHRLPKEPEREEHHAKI